MPSNIEMQWTADAAVVLYRDSGVYRVRTERGASAPAKSLGRAVREADVDELCRRLSALQVSLAPEQLAADYCDASSYELRGWVGNCGFALRWLEDLPAGWACLNEIVAWLERRRPE